MSFEEIMASLKKREFKPIYFFDGEETYYMDVMTEYIAENVLAVEERDFNQTILYAKDLDPSELSIHVKQFPMLAERRVVIVKEAQTWSRKLDALLPLVDHPVPTTVLVINYRDKKLNGTTALAKRLKKAGVYHNGTRLYDNKIIPWLTQRSKERNMDLDSRAAVMLAESIGSDLTNLNKALDRLDLVNEGGGKITAEMVQKHIGISKDFNVFELQKALGLGDTEKAMMIANHFANNEKDHHVIMIVSRLFHYYSKLILMRSELKGADDRKLASALGVHPYFVGEYKKAAAGHSQMRLMKIIEILHDIDLKSKGVGSTSAQHAPLMREMVARIVRT